MLLCRAIEQGGDAFAVFGKQEQRFGHHLRVSEFLDEQFAKHQAVGKIGDALFFQARFFEQIHQAQVFIGATGNHDRGFVNPPASAMRDGDAVKFRLPVFCAS